MLDDLNLFIAIVDAGSLSAAARQHNIPAATLTRRLQKLEQQLGCKLLYRHSRGLSLTPEGQRYYQRCQPLLAALLQHAEEIKQNSTQIKGRIKLLAPTNFAVFPLQTFWQDFLQRYPDINLQLQLDNELDDLMAQGADLALRVGKQPNSAYLQKRIGSVSTCIVASADYLARHPIAQPQDLETQTWLVCQPLDHFELRQQAQTYSVRPKIQRVRVNEISLCVQLAEQGLGLSFVPLTQCQAALATGRLQRVLPEWQTPVRQIYLVCQAQHIVPARVRVLIDALQEFMARQTWNIAS